MENMIEKARAGRTKALEARVARGLEMSLKSSQSDRQTKQRRTSLPVFISCRTRSLTPAYLH